LSILTVINTNKAIKDRKPLVNPVSSSMFSMTNSFREGLFNSNFKSFSRSYSKFGIFVDFYIIVDCWKETFPSLEFTFILIEDH